MPTCGDIYSIVFDRVVTHISVAPSARVLDSSQPRWWRTEPTRLPAFGMFAARRQRLPGRSAPKSQGAQGKKPGL